MSVIGGYEMTVKPSRSPDSEHVYAYVEKAEGKMFAHFYFTRDEAYELGMQLVGAADWLDHQAHNTGKEQV